MRIYPGTTVDYEFATLGGLGYTGTLNDRQFAALRAEGLTGSLADMFKQFDGTLGGGSPTLSEQVQALLAGTTGFALDPSDLTTMHQDTARTVPVTTAADPVGNIRSKWGTTAFDIQQATAATRPAWNGVGGMSFDNADDSLNFPLAMMRNRAACFVAFRMRPTTIGSDSTFFVSTGTGGTTHRFDGIISADGSYRFGGRRLDADGLSSGLAPAATLVANNNYVMSMEIDYAGTGALRGWVNGSLLVNTTISGTVGNTSDTDSLAATFGRLSSTRFDGLLGKFAFLPFIPTAEQRADVEAWIAEGALL